MVVIVGLVGLRLAAEVNQHGVQGAAANVQAD